jgi:hypothetical protein
MQMHRWICAVIGEVAPLVGESELAHGWKSS